MTSIHGLAAYLKARGLVIVCGAGTLALEPAIREAAESANPRDRIFTRPGSRLGLSSQRRCSSNCLWYCSLGAAAGPQPACIAGAKKQETPPDLT
jgi:hypothetical protein